MFYFSALVMNVHGTFPKNTYFILCKQSASQSVLKDWGTSQRFFTLYRIETSVSIEGTNFFTMKETYRLIVNSWKVLSSDYFQ